MAEVSNVPWRERERLEPLLFEPEEELVLSSGRTRWLAHATREVEGVLDRVRATEQHRRNTDHGNAWLTTTQLNDVRTLITRGPDTGADGAGSLGALATEIDGTESSLLGLANTQHLGRNVFAGTAAGSAVTPVPGAAISLPDRGAAAAADVSPGRPGGHREGAAALPGGLPALSVR